MTKYIVIYNRIFGTITKEFILGHVKFAEKLEGNLKKYINLRKCSLIVNNMNSNKPIVENKYQKTCVSKGDYQRTRGVRSQQKIPNGKIFGFRRFDKVKYLNQIYFIKDIDSEGYVTLMDINLQTIKLNPKPKFNLLTRISARTTTLVIQSQTIVNALNYKIKKESYRPKDLEVFLLNFNKSDIYIHGVIKLYNNCNKGTVLGQIAKIIGCKDNLLTFLNSGQEFEGSELV